MEDVTRFPVMSCDNQKWIHSRKAREIRILCEYMEVRDRLKDNGVLSTLVVFGSARALNRETYNRRIQEANEALASAKDEEAKAMAARRLADVQRLEWTCEWYDKVQELAKKLVVWMDTTEAKKAIRDLMAEMPFALASSNPEHLALELNNIENGRYVASALCSGGGPGFMEAANRGARAVDGARSIGFGIAGVGSEKGLNKYVDHDLSFTFNYFFTRKFWMTYIAVGVIVAPGGVGTLDELMEILNLKWTQKLKRDIPVVLFGTEFWKNTVNFQYMAEKGMVNKEAVDQLFFTDDPEEAFQYLRKFILSGKLLLRDRHIHKSLREGQSS